MEVNFAKHGLDHRQFKNMSIDVFIDETVYEKNTSLRQLETWINHWNANADDGDPLMKYIILMYDAGTPLMKAFPELEKRKKVAFELAGLTDKATRTMLLQDKMFEATKMAFEFMRHQRNMLWNLIVTNEAMFYDAMKNMMDDTTADKDKDLMAALKLKDDMAIKMEKAHKRLQSYLKEFYGNDEKMVQKHNVISRKMTSENIARRMS